MGQIDITSVWKGVVEMFPMVVRGSFVMLGVVLVQVPE